MFLEFFWNSSQGCDHPRHYCCFLFPKLLHFDLEVLVLHNLFDLFLLNSTISWYYHINEPHLLLLNHCDIWYVVRQMFISLNLEIPKYFDVLLCKTFSTLCSYYLSAPGIVYFFTDSNVALRPLYYDTSYSLSALSYCRR